MKNDTGKRHLFGLCVMALLTAGVHFFVRPCNDDFYYMTFFDDGFWGFIRQSVIHYQTVTGRALVHFLLCPLLLFDMIPFRILNTVFIVLLSVLIALLAEYPEKERTSGVLLAVSLFWLTGYSILTDGVLWGAGALNYLFPSFMIVFYFFLLLKSMLSGKNRWVAAVGFFAAATVEMTGILAIVAVLYSFLFHPSLMRKRKRWVGINLAATLVGYITLYLSPGVGNRLESNGFFTDEFFGRLWSNLVLFSGKIGNVNGLGILCVLTAMLMIRIAMKEKKRGLCAAAGVSVLTLGMVMCGVIYSAVPVFLTVLLFLFVLVWNAVYHWTQREPVVPFFTLCILLSLGICAVSPVTEPRMLFPTAVFLMILCVKNCSEYPLNEIAAGSLTAMSCIAAVILMIRMSANAAVIDENTARTKGHQEGTLILYHVPDDTVGNGTVPSELNFGQYYLSHFHLDETTVLENREPCTATLYCKNRRIQSGAVRRGTVYVPVRLVTELTDAQIDWRFAYSVVTLNGKTYRLTAGSAVVELGNFQSEKLSKPVRMINNSNYLSLQDFNSLFGTEITAK